MAEIYVPTEQYRRAVDAIAQMTGIDPDEIKIALGEEGNIWPETIRKDQTESWVRSVLQGINTPCF
jgi:hypothetical protein